MHIKNLILLTIFSTSSLTFAMEREDANPKEIKSLQTLALKIALTNPRSIITQSLPAQCQIMIHGKLINIEPLIFQLNKSKDPVTGHYPCKICGLSSANNALRTYQIGFSQDSESLLVKSLYGDNDLSHFHRWDTTDNKWETYNLDEISFEKSIVIRPTDKTFDQQFQLYTKPYSISLPARIQFITFNQSKNKLIIAYMNEIKKKSETAFYNLDDDSVIEHNLPQLCLFSAIQHEQKQGRKLQLTKIEQSIFDSLKPETQITVQDFVVPYPS